MLKEIKNFLLLGERIGTAGMPHAEQFKEIAQHGYRVVINLALPTSTNSLSNEGELVSRESMTYVHIPVKFDTPEPADYEKFARMMDLFSKEKVFVHCAMNMRVSAFMFLYRVERGADRREAEEAMKRIWEPYEVWRSFLNERLRKVGKSELI